MTHINGKFVWFELVTKDAKKAQAFYGEVLGWKVESYPMGDFTYDMIKAGDGTVGGYAQPSNGQGAHWISYVSVPDVDAAAKAAVKAGGKTIEPARDVPTVGRMQRIADSTKAIQAKMGDHDQMDYEGLATMGDELRALAAENTKLEERWLAISDKLGN